MSTERIGITMRGDSPREYPEMRDGLARDWADFFRYVAPGVVWVPIPNLGSDTAGFIRALELDAFVLSGGADYGLDPERDRTEVEVLDYAACSDLPVLGVCRGMQMILRYHGLSDLEEIPERRHVGTTHEVEITTCLPGVAGRRRMVNSYHRNGVRLDVVPDGVRVWARTGDGWAEGISSRIYRMIGMMWHPERGRPFRDEDRCIVRGTLDLD